MFQYQKRHLVRFFGIFLLIFGSWNFSVFMGWSNPVLDFLSRENNASKIFFDYVLELKSQEHSLKEKAEQKQIQIKKIMLQISDQTAALLSCPGIMKNKIFSSLRYDSEGRLIHFQEKIESFGREMTLIRDQIQYNEWGEVTGYEEILKENGLIQKTLIDGIQYNERGQRIQYFRTLENQTGISKKIYRRRIEYNPKGWVTHYQDEYTQRGINYVVKRSHIQYSELGEGINFREIFHEKGDYVSADGSTVDINRTTQVERLSTNFDEQGREVSFIEKRKESNGLEVKVSRSGTRYNDKGEILFYQETRDFKGQLEQRKFPDVSTSCLDSFFMSEDKTDPKIMTEITYSIRTEFWDGVYDPQSRLLGFKERLWDSRLGQTEMEIQRSQLCYDKRGNLISTHEKQMERREDGIENQIQIFRHHINYHENGTPCSFIEESIDTLKVKRLKTWEAFSWNPIGLVEGFKETNSVLKGDQVLSSSEEIQDKIIYDGLDQKIAWIGAKKNGYGYEKRQSWKGSYLKLGLLKSQEFEKSDEDLIRLKIEKYRTYDESGRYIKSIIFEKEFLPPGQKLNPEADRKPQFLEQFKLSQFIPPNECKYEKKKYQVRMETEYDLDGNISKTRDWIFENGLRIDRMRSQIIYLGNFETGYSQKDHVQREKDAFFPEGLDYEVLKIFKIELWNPQGLPSQIRERIEDSRKSKAVKEILKKNLIYDPADFLVESQEEITLKGSEGSMVFNTFEEHHQLMKYDQKGRILELLEKIFEKKTGSDAIPHEVKSERKWSGQYNQGGLLASCREESILGEAREIREQENRTYDSTGNLVLYHETHSLSNGEILTQTWWGTQPDEYALENHWIITSNAKRALLTKKNETGYQYNSLGQLKKYCSEIVEQGDILLSSPFPEKEKEKHLSLSRKKIILREDTSYNALGLIQGFTEKMISGSGLGQKTERKNCFYSEGGQLIRYEEQQSYYDHLKRLPYSYRLQQINEIVSFNAMGLVSSQVEQIQDDRCPNLTQIRKKEKIVYNQANQATGWFENDSKTGSDTDQVLSIQTLRERLSTVYHVTGKPCQIQEKILEENTPLHTEKPSPILLTQEWNYYEGTDLLKLEKIIRIHQSPDQKELNREVLERNKIEYDPNELESFYEEIQILGMDPDAIIHKKNCFKERYDCFGRLIQGRTLEEKNGIQYETVQKNRIYDDDKQAGKSFGNLNSYVEFIRETSLEKNANSFCIDRMKRIQRIQTSWNRLGQETGYQEEKTDYYKIDLDQSSWTDTQLPPGIRETLTVRENVETTPQNQILRYQEKETVTGFSEVVPIEIKMSSQNPPQAPKLIEKLPVRMELDYTIFKTYELLGLDSCCRILETRETLYDERKPDLEKEIVKKIREYNPFNLILEYQEKILEKDYATKNIRWVEEKKQTQMEYEPGSDLLKSYQEEINRSLPGKTDQKTESNPGFLIPVSKVLRKWQGNFYQDQSNRPYPFLKDNGEVLTFLEKSKDANWREVLKKEIRQGKSESNPGLSGIQYDLSGRIVSFQEQTTLESLSSHSCLAGEVREIINWTWNSFGEVDSYTQKKGFLEEKDSSITTVRRRCQYDPLGYLTDYDEEKQDLSGILEYTLYWGAEYDGYGRLRSRHQNQIQYIGVTEDDKIKKDFQGKPVCVKAGWNQEKRSYWEVDPDQGGWDSQDRVVAEMESLELIQGVIHTDTTTSRRYTYADIENQPNSILETELNWNADQSKQFLSRRDTQTSAISYDEFGRRAGYEKEVRFGSDPMGRNAVSDSEKFQNILYDSFSREKQSEERILIENFEDVTDYLLFHVKTDWASFGDERSHGKMISSLSYRVETDLSHDPIPSLEKVREKFLRDVEKDFLKSPSDSRIDAYRYQRQENKTVYHKIGLPFETLEKTLSLDIADEKSDRITLKNLLIQSAPLDMEIIKKESPERKNELDLKIILKFLNKDQSVQAISDIHGIKFGVDGHVFEYCDTVTLNGKLYPIQRKNIVYQTQGKGFASYDGEFNSPYSPSRFFHRTTEETKDQWIITDSFYQDALHQKFLNKISHIYNLSGRLLNWIEEKDSREILYKFKEKQDNPIEYDWISCRSTSGTPDKKDDELICYEFLGYDSSGRPTGYVLKKLNPQTRNLIKILKKVTKITYYDKEEPWMDFLNQKHLIQPGWIKSYQIQSEGELKKFENIRYSDSRLIEAVVNGVRKGFGANEVQYFYEGDYVYTHFQNSPAPIYDRYKFKGAGTGEWIRKVRIEKEKIKSYEESQSKYINIRYDSKTGEVTGYDLDNQGELYTRVLFRPGEARPAGYQLGGKRYFNLRYLGKESVVDQVDLEISGRVYQDLILDIQGRVLGYKISGTEDSYSNITYTTSVGDSVKTFDYSNGVHTWGQVDLQTTSCSFFYDGFPYTDIQTDPAGKIIQMKVNGVLYDNILSDGNGRILSCTVDGIPASNNFPAFPSKIPVLPETQSLRGAVKTDFMKALRCDLKKISIPGGEIFEKPLLGELGEFHPSHLIPDREDEMKERAIALIHLGGPNVTKRKQIDYNPCGWPKAEILEIQKQILGQGETFNAISTNLTERWNFIYHPQGQLVCFDEKETPEFGNPIYRTYREMLYTPEGSLYSYQKLIQTHFQIQKDPIRLIENLPSEIKESRSRYLSMSQNDRSFLSEYAVSGREEIHENIRKTTYNDQQKVIERNKTIQKIRTGKNQDGKTLHFKEILSVNESFEYDPLARLCNEKQTLRSSLYPGNQKVIEKKNFAYDCWGRLKGFERFENDFVPTPQGMVLKSSSCLKRISTEYDRGAHVFSFQEEKGFSNSNNFEHLDRLLTEYDPMGRIKIYHDRITFSGSDYEKNQIRKNIVYDGDGHEISFEQFISEQEPSKKISYSQNLIRLDSVFDAFGNCVWALEKESKKHSDSLVLFEGGLYDFKGRYLDFRKTLYPVSTDLKGKFQYGTVSLTEQMNSILDSQGRLRGYKERIWKTFEPEILTLIQIHNRAFNNQGQIISQIRDETKQGTVKNPLTLEERSFFNRKEIKLLSAEYDWTGKNRTHAIFEESFYPGQEDLKPLWTKKVEERLTQGSMMGWILGIEQNIIVKSISNDSQILGDEKIETQYEYDSNKNILNEVTTKQIGKEPLIFGTFKTQINRFYNSSNQMIEERRIEKELLQNEISTSTREDSRGIVSLIDSYFEYNKKGLPERCALLKAGILRDSRKKKDSFIQGQWIFEEGIRYDGAGERVQTESSIYDLKPHPGSEKSSSSPEIFPQVKKFEELFGLSKTMQNFGLILTDLKPRSTQTRMVKQQDHLNRIIQEETKGKKYTLGEKFSKEILFAQEVNRIRYDNLNRRIAWVEIENISGGEKREKRILEDFN